MVKPGHSWLLNRNKLYSRLSHVLNRYLLWFIVIHHHWWAVLQGMVAEDGNGLLLLVHNKCQNVLNKRILTRGQEVQDGVNSDLEGILFFFSRRLAVLQFQPIQPKRNQVWIQVVVLLLHLLILQYSQQSHPSLLNNSSNNQYVPQPVVQLCNLNPTWYVAELASNVISRLNNGTSWQ